MISHWVFNSVDDATKQRLQAYWAKKLPRLQKLLVRYPADLQELRLTISRHRHDSQNSWYEVRGVIHLPTGTLAAEAEGKDPQAALDRVADALVTEIRRHRDLVRNEYIYKRKARNRAELSAAGPLLKRDVEKGRREDFFQLLRPHLRHLRDYARHELKLLGRDGLLHRGEATVDDLLDEVLSRAWREFSNRPRNLSLDLWLIDLVDDTLEEWIKQEPRHHASPEQEVDDVPPDMVPRPDEQEWWTPLLGEDETLTLGDLIPDERETEAWEQLDADEQRERLFSLLRELPKPARQALLLHALEDYNTAEIAKLQDRPEDEVKADIEAARQMLKERLTAEGSIREPGEPATASTVAAETGGS